MGKGEGGNEEAGESERGSKIALRAPRREYGKGDERILEGVERLRKEMAGNRPKPCALFPPIGSGNESSVFSARLAFRSNISICRRFFRAPRIPIFCLQPRSSRAPNSNFNAPP